MNLKDNIIAGDATLADQDEALKLPGTAYLFARFIEGADIEKCQEAACRDPGWAHLFAHDIKDADIEKCQEAACRDPFWAFEFAFDIEDADLSKISELCPKISEEIDELIMNKALV